MGVTIPIVSAFMIICGYLKLHIFYSHFNIDIYNYLEISEIISLFMPDILKYLGMLAVGIFMTMIMSKYLSKYAETENPSEILSSKSFKQRLVKYYKDTWPSHYLALGISLFFLIPFELYPNILKHHAVRYKFELIFFLIFPISYVFAFFWSEIALPYFQNERKNTRVLIGFLTYGAILFLWGAISGAVKLIGYTETGKYYVQFEYQNKSFNSSNNNLYLGQTRKYLFMKNIDINKISVFERKDIKSLELTIKNTY